VHFLGRIESKAVRALMKRADILLLTSLWENLPYACLEAMAAGRAIVASDCGGIPELLRHEVDGLLAHTGNPSSYVEHLDRLLADEELRRRLGASARRRVEERYTDVEVARRSLLFYEHALGAPSPRRSGAGPAEGVPGPGTWFEAWWMRRGAEPREPRLEPEGGPSPLAQVSLPALGFVRAVLSRAYFDRFPGGASPETRFLEDLEDLLLEKARATRADATRGSAKTELVLPPWGHPVLEDEATTGFLLAEFWRLTEEPAALRWLGAVVGAEGFVEAARHRFSLRWLAMLAARRQPGPAVDAALRSLYFDPRMRERIVREDRARLEDPALARDLLPLVEDLGLHVPLERARPVSLAPAPPRRGPRPKGGAAVTVLIPSYRHEAFVREALESVLAQTRTDLKVLLVDDRSPDATVEKARAVDDPRVEVRVNEERLGLGNSVLASLPEVRT
ncbi:MAG: glycosyltransferase, partial [Planctomycetota bacterium]